MVEDLLPGVSLASSSKRLVDQFREYLQDRAKKADVDAVRSLSLGRGMFVCGRCLFFFLSIFFWRCMNGVFFRKCSYHSFARFALRLFSLLFVSVVSGFSLCGSRSYYPFTDAANVLLCIFVGVPVLRFVRHQHARVSVNSISVGGAMRFRRQYVVIWIRKRWSIGFLLSFVSWYLYHRKRK